MQGLIGGLAIFGMGIAYIFRKGIFDCKLGLFAGS